MAAVTSSPEVTEPPDFRSRWRKRLHWDRYHWWHEVVLIAIGYAIYTAIRDLVPGATHRSAAFSNARDVVRGERDLGIFHEQALNHWVTGIRWLSDASDYWYATAHFAVTIAVAVWIVWRHPERARALRIAWYTTNLYALIGFAFFPLAPPRYLDGFHPPLPNLGFVDTIMKYGIWGNVGKSGGSPDGASNPFAAMPSMHIGWSTWCGIVIVVLAPKVWMKVLGALYPLITLFAIIGTANHYFFDAFGGLAALGLGFLTSRLWTGHGPFAPELDRARPPRDAEPA